MQAYGVLVWSGYTLFAFVLCALVFRARRRQKHLRRIWQDMERDEKHVQERKAKNRPLPKRASAS